MDRLTYTPAEFATVFGKERTWAYRQLYNGKVQAITELGRTLIPKSEVDRLLREAGRYLGAKAKVRKEKSVNNSAHESTGAKSWKDALQKRKQPSTKLLAADSPPKRRKTSTAKVSDRDTPASTKQSVYQRMTRGKAVRNGGIK